MLATVAQSHTARGGLRQKGHKFKPVELLSLHSGGVNIRSSRSPSAVLSAPGILGTGKDQVYVVVHTYFGLFGWLVGLAFGFLREGFSV